jgi:hypothetical protein
VSQEHKVVQELPVRRVLEASVVTPVKPESRVRQDKPERMAELVQPVNPAFRVRQVLPVKRERKVSPERRVKPEHADSAVTRVRVVLRVSLGQRATPA